MHAEIQMVLKFGPRDPVAGYFNDGNPPLMFPPAGWPPLNVHLDSSNSQIPPCENYLYWDPDYHLEMCAS